VSLRPLADQAPELFDAGHYAGELVVELLELSFLPPVVPSEAGRLGVHPRGEQLENRLRELRWVGHWLAVEVDRNWHQGLETKLAECDAIDLQGWLVRVLLPEYRLIGTQLYPGDPSPECLQDAEELARFVAGHAERELGYDSRSRILRTRHFSIAIIYVALRQVVEREGLAPYLKRAKRYLFRDRLDAVYLMAYDRNIGAVNTVADELEEHGWVDSVERHEYGLRADFRKRRNIDRDRAIVVCLRGRQVPSSELPGEDLAESPTDELDFPEEIFGLDGQELEPEVASNQDEGPSEGPSS
jgi:hypothetical protein